MASTSSSWSPAALWQRWVTDPLTWIDNNAELPRGRLSVDGRCTVVFVTGAMVLVMLSYVVLSGRTQLGISHGLLDLLGAVAPDLREAVRPYDKLGRNIAWSLGCFTFYFVLPALVIKVVLGHKLSDYGLTLKGYTQHLWIYLVMFIPVGILIVLLADSPDFQRQYPFYKNPVGIADFVVWECFYALQFFSLEFFFRGFLVHGLRDRFGRYAIFVAVIPYTMIHFRKPLYETIGAIIAGTVLAGLSLRTRSILGGFTIHVAVAVCMDIAALATRTN